MEGIFHSALHHAYVLKYRERLLYKSFDFVSYLLDLIVALRVEEETVNLNQIAKVVKDRRSATYIGNRGDIVFHCLGNIYLVSEDQFSVHSYDGRFFTTLHNSLEGTDHNIMSTVFRKVIPDREMVEKANIRFGVLQNFGKFVTTKMINIARSEDVWKKYVVRSREYRNMRRAGVVPFVVINESIYYLLGRDSRSSQLTDFGGSIEEKDERSRNPFITAAGRELREESLNFYGINLRGSVAVFNGESGIIFKDLEQEVQKFLSNDIGGTVTERRHRYLESVEKEYHRNKFFEVGTPENSSVLWIERLELLKLLSSPLDVYSVPRSLILHYINNCT